ncbi:MAG: cell division ATP-binding protein FtsE [Caulobacterales bacterium]|jgi:cell division transport system ATP-binding protein
MVRPPAHDEDLIRAGLAVRLWEATVTYGPLEALSAADFEARAGAVTVVTGPTGSGKSTLIDLLRLRLHPSQGRYALFGVYTERLNPSRKARLRRRIGVAAQSPIFVEHLTAAQNVALPLAIAGVKDRDYANDVAEVLGFVGCAAAADTPVSALSGGERRRVSLARALVAKPDLILADEPTAGLAPDSALRIVRILAEMRRVGTAVIIVSQDHEIAAGIPATRWRIENARLRLEAKIPQEAV